MCLKRMVFIFVVAGGLLQSCAKQKDGSVAASMDSVSSKQSADSKGKKTCPDIASEIMASSATFKNKTEGLLEAIVKNGGTSYGIELEGSPDPIIDKAPAQSKTYDFNLHETYADRAPVVARFSFDPQSKQLYLYDPVLDSLTPIDFDRRLLRKFDEICQDPFTKLPVVVAVGGKGTNVDWKAIAANADPNGPGFFAGDCAEGVKPERASSTLAKQGVTEYEVKNLSDSNPMTAWVEGKPDYGIGEFFEITTPRVNTIYNGYQLSVASWKNNSRVKRFKVYKDGGPLCLLELTDEMGSQRFELPNMEESNQMHTYRFEILDVYKGAKWPDVAISEMVLQQCCFLGNTTIMSESESKPMDGINPGNSIASIDVETGLIKETQIIKTTKQTHVLLLKVTSQSRQIEITPDHPLYFKNHGFLSIARLMKMEGYANYDELMAKTVVLTWNEKAAKLTYEKIVRIETENGNFETYTILKMKEGSHFIANGFVTKIY